MQKVLEYGKLQSLKDVWSFQKANGMNTEVML